MSRMGATKKAPYSGATESGAKDMWANTTSIAVLYRGLEINARRKER